MNRLIRQVNLIVNRKLVSVNVLKSYCNVSYACHTIFVNCKIVESLCVKVVRC